MVPDKISSIVFLVDKPHFFENNEYSFRGARPNYGATVYSFVWF